MTDEPSAAPPKGSAVSRPAGARKERTLSGAERTVLFAVFTGLALLVYGPALNGGFVSDDHLYIVTNTYVHELSTENLIEIWNPWGGPALDTANYAPVHLVSHALEVAAFGDQTLGYHVVNVVLHALASVALVLLLARLGLPLQAATAGGALFLLHPANVEVVAWIFQLKTILALLFSLLALLLLPQRPLVATLLFGLGLLSKISAFYALPVAAVLLWTGTAGLGGDRRRWKWLGVWCLLFALYAIPQFFTFARTGAFGGGLSETGWVGIRSIAAIGLRYLAMAVSSYGVSAFHEPEPASSPFDPWWLGACVAGALLTWRLVLTLRRSSPESAFWIWAAVSWAPISQIFPFLYPMGDRYLYFILPGLVGGALLAGQESWERLRARLLERGWGARNERRVARAALAFGVLMIVSIAYLSTGRAGIWKSDLTLIMDAASHYPDGLNANLLKARSAAQRGDALAAVYSLRRASERGFDRFQILLSDPGLGRVRETPAFQALIHDIAGIWLERSLAKAGSTPGDFRNRGLAHLVRSEYEEAMRSYETALELGSKEVEAIRSELSRARLKRRIELRQRATEELPNTGSNPR